MWRNLVAGLDRHRELIYDALRTIWANPEPGFREWKTHRYMAEIFRGLGYELTEAGDIPGFYTVIDTGRPGPEVLVMGEMDSLIVPEHPDSDPETGAVHSCGHAAQCAALVGIAAALKEPGALDGLCGRIRLCAVPAEELIEIGYRTELRKAGVIRYLGGKTEFIHRGYFDSCDLAIMVHTSPNNKYHTKPWAVGCMSKQITYMGRSAHAGGSPWLGINALYAAQQGLSAINAIRETFCEKDCVRVHPIITAGGSAVNAIPDRVVMESYVRAASFEAMLDANRRVNRALIGAALSMGANIEISDSPGYAPLTQDKELIAVAEQAAGLLDLPYFHNTEGSTGSTDMGDVSQIMPALHPYAPGAVGLAHGTDYRVTNPDLACVGSAAWQLVMLHLLLKNGAEKAKQVVEQYVPNFGSSREYLDYLDTLSCSGSRIDYHDGTAQIKL